MNRYYYIPIPYQYPSRKIPNWIDLERIVEEEGYAITFYHAKISRKKLTSANPFDVRQSMDWVLLMVPKNGVLPKLS